MINLPPSQMEKADHQTGSLMKIKSFCAAPLELAISSNSPSFSLTSPVHSFMVWPTSTVSNTGYFTTRSFGKDETTMINS